MTTATRPSTGGQIGANIWDPPADGGIAPGDIFAVAGQFGHTCTAAP